MSAQGLLRRGKRLGDYVVVNYENMFRFGLVGFLTSGFFLGRAYFDIAFALMGCLAILKRVAREEWARDQEYLDATEMSMEPSGRAIPALVEES
jgi:hypothetical protein